MGESDRDGREAIFDRYSSAKSLCDDGLLREVEKCHLTAMDLLTSSEDALRKRALLASLGEIRALFRRASAFVRGGRPQIRVQRP